MPSSVAGSDGYAEYLRQVRTPTQNAVEVTRRLEYLWQQIKDKERELAIYVRMPDFDKDEYKRLMESEEPLPPQ